MGTPALIRAREPHVTAAEAAEPSSASTSAVRRTVNGKCLSLGTTPDSAASKIRLPATSALFASPERAFI